MLTDDARDSITRQKDIGLLRRDFPLNQADCDINIYARYAQVINMEVSDTDRHMARLRSPARHRTNNSFMTRLCEVNTILLPEFCSSMRYWYQETQTTDYVDLNIPHILTRTEMSLSRNQGSLTVDNVE